MGVLVRWLNEDQTTICYEFEENWSWDEVYILRHQTNTMIKSVAHNVNLLVEFKDFRSSLVPNNIFSHADQLLSKIPDNFESIVILTNNRRMRLLVDTFVRIFPLKISRRMYVASTMDEAYRLLNITAKALAS